MFYHQKTFPSGLEKIIRDSNIPKFGYANDLNMIVRREDQDVQESFVQIEKAAEEMGLNKRRKDEVYAYNQERRKKQG